MIAMPGPVQFRRGLCVHLLDEDDAREGVHGLGDELGLGDAVRLVGPQSPFGPVMAGFSALVAPARNEALGRTLIEAGLAGVPLIATLEGGNTEIVEDGLTGHLVAPDDVEGFAQAVLEVLSDPESSAARCAAAQTRCERLFSLGAHVSAIEAIYDEIT